MIKATKGLKRQEGLEGQQGLFLLGRGCPSRPYRHSCPYSRSTLTPIRNVFERLTINAQLLALKL